MEKMRPLGSEKLQGDEKIKRILELTNYQTSKTKKKTVDVEFISESVNGFVYGIVREKDGYYVKKGINENTLDYIGGMFMKNKNRFKSYNEALKKLDFISGQEALNEEKRYVLKRNKPATDPSLDDMPAAEENPSTEDLPTDSTLSPGSTGDSNVPADGGDSLLDDGMNNETDPMGGEYGDDTETGSKEGMDNGGEEDNEGLRSSYMEEIQKFSGKLGQELRDQRENLESDDIKYVLNMIISAIDLDQLDDEDLDDIADKFKKEPEDESMDAPEPEPEYSEESLAEEEDFEDDQMGEPEGTLRRNPIKTSGKLDVSQFSDLKEFEDDEEFGNDEETENGEPAWLETLWNVNPGLAKRAEAYINRLMGKSPEENSEDEGYVDENDEQILIDKKFNKPEEDEDVEIDMDEIKRELSRTANGVLSKYFK